MQAAVYERLERDRRGARALPPSGKRASSPACGTSTPPCASTTRSSACSACLPRNSTRTSPVGRPVSPGEGSGPTGTTAGSTPRMSSTRSGRADVPAPTRALINGRWHDLTPGQGARLAAAEARTRDALEKCESATPIGGRRPSSPTMPKATFEASKARRGRRKRASSSCSGPALAPAASPASQSGRGGRSGISQFRRIRSSTASAKTQAVTPVERESRAQTGQLRG